MHTWQDIIEREDMNAFRALLEQYKSRFEKEFIAGEEGSRRIEYNYNFKEKILETLVNNSKIDMLKVFAEHYDGICAIPTYRHRYLIDPFSNPISKNPNLDEIIFILGSHNLLHHKIINVVLDDLCNLDTRETKNIQRIKLLLFFDSASHTKSMIRLYDTITKKINATMQEPNSEEKTEKLAYLNAIKNIFDEVDKLDKQGIPRKQMEVLQSSTAKKINKR